ncbi:MAG: hypothetical protein CML44_00715 [Rhodobacteraceae bacterium]|nr:hypothetical protein [Paracoccaceae bacterium]
MIKISGNWLKSSKTSGNSSPKQKIETDLVDRVGSINTDTQRMAQTTIITSEQMAVMAALKDLYEAEGIKSIRATLKMGTEYAKRCLALEREGAAMDKAILGDVKKSRGRPALDPKVKALRVLARGFKAMARAKVANQKATAKSFKTMVSLWKTEKRAAAKLAKEAAPAKSRGRPGLTAEEKARRAEEKAAKAESRREKSQLVARKALLREIRVVLKDTRADLNKQAELRIAAQKKADKENKAKAKAAK